MSNGIKYFVTFALGAAAGSVAAWAFLKPKYEQMAKEEIEEVREYYRRKEESLDGEPDKNSEAETLSKDDIEEREYRDLVNTHYIGQEGGSEMAHDDVPYVISPEEFAADDEYQSESLTYYADGVLTDDFDNPIEDVDSMVGDALEHFGEYEDDSVFVRNDRYKCNYEILKDDRDFSDVQNRILNLVDDE